MYVCLSDYVTGKITLVCLAPLTNVAVALRIDPTFGTKLRQCIIMGGNTTGNYLVICVYAFCVCMVIFVIFAMNHPVIAMMSFVRLSVWDGCEL